ncbi:hypothetical protein T09_9325 [Trichinella sp. T9]|nr:hypothetical protein T09_9325 [Trichinella sp. T9]
METGGCLSNTSDAEDEDKELDRTVFAVTFPSCPSVVSLIIKQISLSQSSSVRTNPVNILVIAAFSAFAM